MAARDRFGSFADPSLSPLQRAIRMSPNAVTVCYQTANGASFLDDACNPSLYEPNLALNLDVADLINSKKGNA